MFKGLSSCSLTAPEAAATFQPLPDPSTAHCLYNPTVRSDLAPATYQLCDPWQVANFSAAQFP